MRTLGNWAKVECHCVECGKSVSVSVCDLPAFYIVCEECKKKVEVFENES